MLRYVLVFLAGVPIGPAIYGYVVGDPVLWFGGNAASMLIVLAACFAAPRRLPQQRLQSHLMGLRVVGREERR